MTEADLDELDEHDLKAYSEGNLDALSQRGLAIVAGIKNEWADSQFPQKPKSSLVQHAIDFVKGIGKSSVTGPAIPIGGMLTGQRPCPYGAPFGPAGVAGAAAVGAGAGAFGAEGIRRGLSQITGQEPPQTTEQNLEGMAKTAITYGASEALGQGAVAGLSGLSRKVLNSKLMPGLVRAFSGTPEKRTAFLAKNPDAVANAASASEMGKAYNSFEKSNKLKGILQTMQDAGKVPSSGEMIKNVLTTANKVRAGEPVVAQELYTASQYASNLKLTAKFGEPTAQNAVASGLIDKNKPLIDSALENSVPGYTKLRIGNMASKTKEAISSALPLNKNLSPNVLRTVGPSVAAIRDFVGSGNPLGLMMLPAFSPMTYGEMVKLAAYMARAGQPTAHAAGAIAGSVLNEK